MLRGATIALLLTITLAAPARADTALEWYDHTADAVAAFTPTTPVTSSRVWAVSWLSAHRTARLGDAAVATALHDALVAQVPARRAELDAALAATLDRVPDGPRKRAAIRAGRRAAARTLAQREGDGLDVASVNAPFPIPPAAPGVWQPTPPAFAPPSGAGQGGGRAFVLRSPDQFRAPPPPALDSAAYLRDFEEGRLIGSATSTERTPEQAEVGRFWTQGSLDGYRQVLRAVLERTRHPLRFDVAFLAAFHIVTVDVQIAIYEAKYHYLRWRPVTAIREVDPTWLPLATTPSHPDYPGGHASFAGAAEQVLTTFVGPRPRAPIAVTSSALPGVTRSYDAWAQLTFENVNAHVWNGTHTRTSAERSAGIGRAIAAYVLCHSSTSSASSRSARRVCFSTS